ncbi:MAG: hypothetical protein D6707_00775 [Bacteroidetes bacterium]|nr:MAG: hypothetical protein D6707_00775 [Bacteroidota bacterium]
MKNNNLIIVAGIVFLTSCNILQKTAYDEGEPITIDLDTVRIEEYKQPVYQASEKRINDLIHTKLDVRFDWEKQYLYGKAHLTLKPYFYPTDSLVLDAKGFDIHKVELTGKENKPLAYQYDGNVLKIELDKIYTRKDTYQIFIDYTAKPNEREAGGSRAITSDKGLYFINPLGKDPNKPRQIWTQGETESNSCWFPTIDKPNEKMTQEIKITVDTNFVTLSNGLLEMQTENGDGTRSDYWAQYQPHAPYLVMMAIGEFTITEDSWRDSIPVHYYLEKEYQPYAKEIFGRTPKMIEFFSKRLGYDYPWKKYHQVVVRDYVSGAMENTTAVIHGEFVQKTHRQMIDGNSDDIIAHELFHHWFGDLVTCESWANLPLNESFATYGEYLWREFYEGKASADFHLDRDLNRYLLESERKQVDMIRFDYEDREDMFDAHSYAKGGRILHMLRNYVGDEAFFAALQYYLKQNEYRPVEIHHLRLAFEEITGEDLNWFFNQWFLASGHPELEITQSYNDSLQQLQLTVEQKQDLTKTPLYQLPVAIDIYTEKGKIRKKVWIKQGKETFVFKTDKPLLVNFDGDKMLLCEKTDLKSLEQWIYQYYHAPLYKDKAEAIEVCGFKAAYDKRAAKVILDALSDSLWMIRKAAIDEVQEAKISYKEDTKNRLAEMTLTDENPLVRAAALDALVNYFDDVEIEPLLIEKTADSSYAVLASVLRGMAKINPQKALELAKKYENENESKIISQILRLYAEHGDSTKFNYFMATESKLSSFSKFSWLINMETFLVNHSSNDSLLEAGINKIAYYATSSGMKFLKNYAQYSLVNLVSVYDAKIQAINQKIQTITDEKEIAELQKKQDYYNAKKQEIKAYIEN